MRTGGEFWCSTRAVVWRSKEETPRDLAIEQRSLSIRLDRRVAPIKRVSASAPTP